MKKRNVSRGAVDGAEKFDLAAQAMDRRAKAIRAARAAAGDLVIQSESLRVATESTLNQIRDADISLKDGQRIRDRLDAIRASRNGMVLRVSMQAERIAR